MKNLRDISSSLSEAIKYDSKKHEYTAQSNICVVCDELIIGLEPLKVLLTDDIVRNRDRISIDSFESHYRVELSDDLRSQYQIDDEALYGLLLSPRARKFEKPRPSYTCCCKCHKSMTSPSKEEKINPPKFAIANGFVIGHIPRNKLIYQDANNEYIPLPQDFDPDKHLDDLICAAISPVRPYGYVHAYQGGSQKSITGHFSFFSVDQSHVGGVLNKYKNVGDSVMQTSKNIFVVLCGRMTPKQKKIIKDKSIMDTRLFLHLLNWFVRESGHRGFKDVTPPDECPDMVAFMRDEDTENNTDDPIDDHVECKMEGKTYYFSDDLNNPNTKTSFYDATEQFVSAMLNNTDPTMLMYGGSYLKSHEIHLEDVFPIQFPFGLGGPNPNCSRKVPVSEEACMRHYMRLSLKQFMRPDFILVCYHLLCRCESYTTGLIKCKSDYRGEPLAEKISKLTANDIECAVSDLSMRQLDGDDSHTRNVSSSFLKSVTTSCKVLGHTTEAAKEARRKMYSLTDRFGPHSLFFTITPDDLCTYRVRMFAAEGNEISIPVVDCSEDQCILDFSLRAKTRTQYPGACSIFYQAAMQVVYDILGWDPIRNCRKSVGLFGRTKAIGRGDEEQNRGTLHGHTLVWLENFSRMTRMLFHPDAEKRESARKGLIDFVDRFFQSDYNYDQSLKVVHRECGQSGTVSDMFEETELQDLRDCRNKHLCQDLGGKVLRCKHCHSSDADPSLSCISTQQLNDMVIESYKHLYEEGSASTDGGQESTDENNSSHVDFPFSSHRIDIMTYQVDKMNDENSKTPPFYKDKNMRHHVANRRMNEHDSRHRKACFKYDDSCRARMPKMASEETKFIYDDEDDSKRMIWSSINESSDEVYPFSISPRRSIGSEYLNTFNNDTFSILHCNNNIQLGSAKCLFYVVHYATKSTQKEDRGEDFEKIGQQVIRRIQKEQERLTQEEKDALKTSETNNDQYSFREGLSRFLLGMNVHLSQDVVSATMAHLLICQRGSRFTFSHDFKNMLVGQMLNHLNGDDPGDFVLKRKNRSDSNESPILWADYSVNDYIYRHECLENISFYEFCIRFEKGYFTFSQMSKRNEHSLPVLDESNGLHFQSDHPGRQYCYLKPSSKEYVPLVSSPKGMICDLEFLELDQEREDCEFEPSRAALDARENYAKCALVMFYPFRDKELFTLGDTDDCIWDKFQRLMSVTQGSDGVSFWDEGVDVLQNIQDRIQSIKASLPADELESLTVNRAGKISNFKSNHVHADSDSEWEDADSVGSYENEDMYTDFTSEEDNVTARRLNDLKKGMEMVEGDVINTRLSQATTIFQPAETSPSVNEKECSANQCSPQAHPDSNTQMEHYTTLLAFVSGSLAVKNLSQIPYQCNEQQNCDSYSMSEKGLEGEADISEDVWISLGVNSSALSSSVPTICGIAEKLHKTRGILLDHIQFVAYKIICSSFMLNAVNEGWNNKLLQLSSMLGSDEPDDTEKKVKNSIVQKLEKMGGKDQLLMFVTGPAGAGKSTALEVAQHFCFEFTRAVGQHWDETTFLFTAMTGCAASLFGGVTLHSAAFLNQNLSKISDKSMQRWDNVKVLVVDEISMASNKIMKKLNDVLNKTRRNRTPASPLISPTMIFGGYSIIFCGDFHQIPPVKVPQSEFLYSNRGLWENAINVAIVLENSHRFKEDPEYGQILMRIWRGELTEDDREAINSRLVGIRGISLPEISTHSDIVYSCPRNVQRDLIHTELFQKHIKNFPDVTSDELPPKHTIILEADITQAPKSKRRSDSETRPRSIRVSKRIMERIYSRCGDSDVTCNKKHIDPAIKTYAGGHAMVNDNDGITEGLANGTTCALVSVKRKHEDAVLRWRNVDGKKVYAEKVSDTEYLEMEHFPPTFTQRKILEEISLLEQNILNECTNDDIEVCKQKIESLRSQYNVISQRRRFRLYPKEYNCIFDKNLLTVDDFSFRRGILRRGLLKKNCKVRLKQYPINLNDATTGHKLQGSSKDMLIVRSWSYTPGWMYTNLSRVRTLKGLYLMQELKPSSKERETSFIPSRSLLHFEHRMKSKIPHELRKDDSD